MEKRTGARGPGGKKTSDDSVDASYRKASLRQSQTTAGTALFFERSGFTVSEYNNGTHLVLRGRGLKVDYWPTAGKFMAMGRVFRATPQDFVASAMTGKFRPPDSKSRCKRCGTAIFWTKSARGRWMPLDSDGGAHMAHCRKTQ